LILNVCFSSYLQRFRSVHFPEKVNNSRDSENWGVGVSGGGYRAFVSSMGQLSALLDSGFFSQNKVDYLSCVSGGCFSSTIFTHGRNPNFSDSIKSIKKDPSEITVEWLNQPIDPECPLNLATKDADFFSFSTLTKNPKYSKPIIKDFLIKELYEKYCINVEKSSYLEFWERRNFPFLIVNSIVSKIDGFEIVAPFESTPLYMGVPLPRKERECTKFVPSRMKKVSKKIEFGGYWLGPNSLSKSNKEFRKNPCPKLWALGNLIRLNLDRLLFEKKDKQLIRVLKIDIFASPFDFWLVFDNLGHFSHLKKSKGVFEFLPLSFDRNFRPGFHHANELCWSSDLISFVGLSESYHSYFSQNFHFPSRDTKKKSQFYRFGDGGYIDNYGIGPLLRRRVENIIVLCNGRGNQMNPTRTINMEKREHNGILNNHLSAFFGFKNTENNRIELSDLTKSHFFKSERFKDLVKKFEKHEKEGKPHIVEINDVEVVENEFMGVKGGWKVKRLVFVYLQKENGWIEKLPKEAKEIVEKIENFPFYQVVGHRKFLSPILNQTDIKLLGSMSYWAVKCYFR